MNTYQEKWPDCWEAFRAIVRESWGIHRWHNRAKKELPPEVGNAFCLALSVVYYEKWIRNPEAARLFKKRSREYEAAVSALPEEWTYDNTENSLTGEAGRGSIAD